MLNRLGLVIHWSGFISGLMAFALCFSVVGFFLYEEWIEPAITDGQHLEELRVSAASAKNNEFRLRSGSPSYDPPIAFDDNRTELEITKLLEEERIEIERLNQSIGNSILGQIEREEGRLRNRNPWYWYVLGLPFSPFLIVLIMLPAWATRFILTGEKVFFPWRSTDA